jgi:serine/threonine protein kinase
VAGDSPAQLGGLLTGLSPGSRVGGYLLERLIGVGGMAAVFRARDERLGRVVALKLLTGDEVVRRRFAREARAVAAVDHPHIIPVYEAGESGAVLYIAMRYVAGDDLRVIVTRDGALTPRRAAGFISAVASALDTAHDAGLIHRDVKPANMLVDVGPGRPEHVYLSDFGLARSLLSAGGLTGAGQFLGTPDYAAPEQISGGRVDGRVDQYALGCVAYTLLSGSVPFEREEPMALLYAHLSAPPPALTAVRPELPAEVDEVLATALAKAPGDRYESCGEFADALREAIGLEPYDPSGPPRPHGHPHQPGRTVPGRTRPDGAGAQADSAGAQADGAGADAARGVSTKSMTLPDPPAAATWVAVVTADHAYYESVRADADEDVASIGFPVDVPERRFELSGAEVRIGRHSSSQHIDPEIDLAGPPRDPGVSRLHAVLTAGQNGTWSVTDPGTENGIVLNGKEIAPHEAVPLRDGDRLHLGMWTLITIVSEPVLIVL